MQTLLWPLLYSVFLYPLKEISLRKTVGYIFPWNKTYSPFYIWRLSQCLSKADPQRSFPSTLFPTPLLHQTNHKFTQGLLTIHLAPWTSCHLWLDRGAVRGEFDLLPSLPSMLSPLSASWTARDQARTFIPDTVFCFARQQQWLQQDPSGRR